MSADDLRLLFRTMSRLASDTSKTAEFIIYVMATHSIKIMCSALHIFSTPHIEVIITIDHGSDYANQ